MWWYSIRLRQNLSRDHIHLRKAKGTPYERNVLYLIIVPLDSQAGFKGPTPKGWEGKRWVMEGR